VLVDLLASRATLDIDVDQVLDRAPNRRLRAVREDVVPDTAFQDFDNERIAAVDPLSTRGVGRSRL